jgi:hypothetical protein
MPGETEIEVMTRRIVVGAIVLALAGTAWAAPAATGRPERGAEEQARERDRHPDPRPQPRAEPRPEPRPQPRAVPRPVPRPAKRGSFIFIGGYFYDPFFGPYPWWPRGTYPPWYYPAYDFHAEVRVAATPRHAAVYVDGFYAGLVDDFDGTFQRLALPAGGHRIALYLDGFVTQEFSVYLRPGSTFTLHHTMLRLAPGDTSDRPEVAAPVPPPPPGTYTPPRSTPPSLPTTPSSAPLPEHVGTVEVRVQPATAEVVIDGTRWLSSDPGLFVVQVPVGRHHVEVTAPGYRPFATDVQVSEGDPTPLNVSLVRVTTR